MFRKLHRWTSLPLVIFLILVSATGVALQVEELVKHWDHGWFGGQSEEKPKLAAAPMTQEQINKQLSDAITKAKAAHPDFTPSRIELNIGGGAHKTRLAQQPRGGPYIEIDHATGAVKAELKPQTPIHAILIRLHTGSMGGKAGLWVIFAASLIMLFLSVSGAVLYWQMWKNRAGRGMKDIFWK